jgi:hypothetical protein
MANPDRLLDGTSLSMDFANERILIHRDWMAHVYRWTHICKWLMQKHRYQGASIIDVGCGVHQPFPRMMYTNRMTGCQYLGIDYNPVEFHPVVAKMHSTGAVQCSLMDETDCGLVDPADLPWGLGDVGICLEVLEHMQPWILRRMLLNWKRMFNEGATLFVSTPVFNGSAAANHINEMGRLTLGQLFEFHGFTVEASYGTFASLSELIPVMSAADRSYLDRIRDYYDSNALSVMMAPLYPQGSRNVLWRIRNKAPTSSQLMFWKADGELVLDANQNPDILEAFHGQE